MLALKFQYQASNSHADSPIRGKVDRQEQLRTFFDMQDAAGRGGFLLIFFLVRMVFRDFSPFCSESTVFKPQQWMMDSYEKCFQRLVENDGHGFN